MKGLYILVSAADSADTAARPELLLGLHRSGTEIEVSATV